MFSAADPGLHDLISLKGKRAVVTGTGQGIGAAIAARLAEAGAEVVVSDIDIARARDVAAHINDRTGRTVTTAFRCDVSDVASVRTLAAEAGDLDIWVNNAGIFPFEAALDITPDAWREVMKVNADGAFFGAQAAASHMTHSGRGGVVINVASTAGLRGRANLTHYAASKHAVVGLTRCLAIELEPRNIRVMGVAPTLVQTPGIAAQRNTLPDTVRHYVSNLPLGRIAQPDDIARVVLFCASDLASLLTGSVIPVDAGGLAVATNFASAGFAAASGSSLATCAAMGRIAIPQMLRNGYDPGLAAGSVAAAGTLGALIPPSILFVLYGWFTGTSIGALLLAGVIPGILTALVYSGMVITRCKFSPKIAPPVNDQVT